MAIEGRVEHFNTRPDSVALTIRKSKDGDIVVTGADIKIYGDLSSKEGMEKQFTALKGAKASVEALLIDKVPEGE